MISRKVIVFFFLFCIVFIYAEGFESIHQIELLKHKGIKHIPNQPIYYKKTRTTPCVDHTVFGFYPYWSSYSYVQWDLLTHIAYFSLEFDPSTGNFTDKHGWPDTTLLAVAHDNGVKVILVATNFGSTNNDTFLGNTTARSVLINNLVNEVQSTNADGVNIDFESVPSSQKANFVQFITDLHNALKNANNDYELTICGPAIDWNGAYDYDQLALNSEGIFIMAYDYHWSGSSNAGPVSPLNSSSTWGQYCVRWTINDYIQNGIYKDKFILGVPYYGYDWPTEDSSVPSSTTKSGSAKSYSTCKSEASNYGENWDNDSSTPWYYYDDSGQIHQVWYDNDNSLGLKYDLLISTDFQGTGMWAIGYDGSNTELWDKLREKFCVDQTPPNTPVLYAVIQNNTNSIEIKWKKNTESDLAYYKIFISTDGTNFPHNYVVESGKNSYVYSINDVNSVYYARIQAFDTSNNGSVFSDIYSCRPREINFKILIVEDDNRSGYCPNNHNLWYAKPLSSGPYYFDSCGSEAVIDNIVSLNSYPAVIWFCGADSYSPTNGTGTFNSSETPYITIYLENGGHFFSSGAEIGYDLVYKDNDSNFYHNYLKSDYVKDDFGDYNITGSGIFNGINFEIYTDDTGSDSGDAAYQTKWPDAITNYDGSQNDLTSNGYYCGIEYTGILGNGTKNSNIVNFGFPFETINNFNKRWEIIDRIMCFFDNISPTLPQLEYVQSDSLTITCYISPSPSVDVEKYGLFYSTDVNSWKLGKYFNGNSTTYILPHKGLFYIGIKAFDRAGNSSSLSQVFPIYTGGKVYGLLISDDYRYYPNDDLLNYGKTAKEFNFYFDTVSSKYIITHETLVNNYKYFIWSCGRDSYPPTYGSGTINSDEQTIIKSILNNGKNLFLNGSEIAYDLDYKGRYPDFYHYTIKSKYNYDDGQSNILNGINNTYFSDLSGIEIYTDDNSSVEGDAAYQVKWPDSISNYDTTSQTIINYSSGRPAGIYYEGNVQGNKKSKLFNMGFPFETINNQADRDAFFKDIIKTFTKPQNLWLEPYSKNSINLFWENENDNNLVGYYVYYSTDGINYIKYPKLFQENKAVIDNLDNNTTYYFKSDAYIYGNESYFSNVVIGSPKELEITNVFAEGINSVVVEFNNCVLKNDAINTANYSLSPNVKIDSIDLYSNYKGVVLRTEPLTFGTTYILTIDSNFHDTDGFLISTNGNTYTFKTNENSDISISIDGVINLENTKTTSNHYILFPHFIEDNLDNKIIYLSDNNGNKAIYSVNISTDAMPQLIYENNSICDFSKISSGGNGGGKLDYIYFSMTNNDNYSQIYRIKEDGSGLEHISTAATGYYSNWYDPDYSNKDQPIDSNGNGDDRIVCSVDGELVVFDPDDCQDSLIRLTTLRNGSSDTISDRCIQPIWWEADGSYTGNDTHALKVVFVREERHSKVSNIYVLNDVDSLIKNNMPNGSKITITSWNDTRLTKITDNDYPDYDPNISIDGKIISYCEDINNIFSNETFNSGLINQSLDGTNFNIYMKKWDDPNILGDENNKYLSPEIVADNSYSEAFLSVDPINSNFYSYVLRNNDGSCELKVLPITSKDITDSNTKILRDFNYTEVYVNYDDLSGNAELTATPLLSNMVENDSRLISIGDVRDFFGNGSSIDFKHPVKMVIHYNDVDNNGYVDGTGDPGIRETELKVYYYNTQLNKWEEIGGVVNPDKNTLTIYVNHFSKYGIFSKVKNTFKSNDIRAFPNPCHVLKPENSNGVCFDRLPPVKDIKIYTISGELVSTIKHGIDLNPTGNIYSGTDLLNYAYWRGKNQNGKIVASGIYIYVIKLQNGEKKIGKIAIIK